MAVYGDEAQLLGSTVAARINGALGGYIGQERLEREFDLGLVATAPSVVYRVTHSGGEVQMIDNPAHWPPLGKIDSGVGIADSDARKEP